MKAYFKLRPLAVICAAAGSLTGQLSLAQSDRDRVETVVVIGQTGALNKSLRQQREADNLITVLSSDNIGEFPDSNASESLQRMVGLSIERDQGEGRFVRVRGLGPDLNGVTLNGARVPSPESGRRAVALDVVPSDLLESLEVTKVHKPEMDADSLGGAINIRTLSAFDRDGTYYKARAEGSFDENRDEYSPKTSAVYSDVYDFGGRRDSLGIAVAGSWENRKFGSDNTETGGNWSLEDSGPLLEEFEARDYDIERERLGLAVNIDFRLSDSAALYLRALYSEFSDDEVRNAIINEFAAPAAAGAADNSVSAGRELKAREEVQIIQSIVAGGEYRWHHWALSYQAGYSRAEEENDRGIAGALFAGSDDFAGAGFRNSREPAIIAGADYFDSASYQLDEIEVEDTLAEDDATSVRFDLARTLVAGGTDWELKTGVKVSRREKTNRQTTWVIDDFGANSTALVDYAGATLDYPLGGFGRGIDAGAVRAVVNSVDLAGFVDDEESSINDFSIDEDIDAAYVQARAESGRWVTLFGVRHERTDVSASGFAFNDGAINPRNVDNDYGNTLPSAQLKYTWNDNTVLRAAYSNSLVRPTFEQLSPGFLIDGDEAEAGNPQLDPLESRNVDIAVEHYLGDVGVVSVGVFNKDIDNFIYETVSEVTGESYEELTTFVNGRDASLSGIEFNYVQRLSHLPGFWQGLLISGNFTVTDSEADIGARDIPFPSQSDETANFAIGYEQDWLSLRLSATYKSEYLIEVGDAGDGAEDIYETDHTQLDFIGKIYLDNNIVLSLKALNLTDEPFYTYSGRESLNHQYEEYGRTLQLGISLSSF